jgi:hypothetical protein
MKGASKRKALDYFFLSVTASSVGTFTRIINFTYNLMTVRKLAMDFPLHRSKYR